MDFKKEDHKMADGPSNNDVLFGRDAVAFNHRGNQALRHRLIPLMAFYQNLPTVPAKTKFLDDIVEQLRRENVVFWRKSNDDGSWREATADEARSKVRSLLRDKNHRRMHETYFQHQAVAAVDVVDADPPQPSDEDSKMPAVPYDTRANEAPRPREEMQLMARAPQLLNGQAPQQPVAGLHGASHQTDGMAMSQPAAAFYPVASMNSQRPRGPAPLQQMYRTLATMDRLWQDGHGQGGTGGANLNPVGGSQGSEMPLQTDGPGSSKASKDILDILAALVDVDGLPSSLRHDSSAYEAQQRSNGSAPQLGNGQTDGPSSFTVAPQGSGEAATLYSFGVQGYGTSAPVSTFAGRRPEAQESTFAASHYPGVVVETQGGVSNVDVDSAGQTGQEEHDPMSVVDNMDLFDFDLSSEAEHSFQGDERQAGTSPPRAEDEDEEMEATGSRPVSPDPNSNA